MNTVRYQKKLKPMRPHNEPVPGSEKGKWTTYDAMHNYFVDRFVQSEGKTTGGVGEGARPHLDDEAADAGEGASRHRASLPDAGAARVARQALRAGPDPHDALGPSDPGGRRDRGHEVGESLHHQAVGDLRVNGGPEAVGDAAGVDG